MSRAEDRWWRCWRSSGLRERGIGKPHTRLDVVFLGAGSSPTCLLRSVVGKTATLVDFKFCY